MQKRASEKIFRWLAIVLLIVLTVYVSWYQLGNLTVRLWDESRLANNAIEMYKTGNYWITTFDYKPDMWNTKPPLMIWLQVLSLRIFGLNDFALRVPSALAAMGVYATVFYFGYKRLNHFWLGFLSVIVLASTQGFIGYHVARYGDFDVLLILFTTLGCTTYFSYLTTSKNKSLYLTFIFFGLSVLTKSIAGLMFGPALVLFTFYYKKIGSLIKNKHTYIGLCVFLLIAGSYYLIREQLNPGYWSAVMKNDLGGRFSEVIEAHNHPWNWYFDLIVKEQSPVWIFVALATPILLFFEKNKLYRDGMIYALLLAISFLLIISSAQTKLLWYPAPAYPFLAIAAAYSVVALLGYVVRMQVPEMIKVASFLVVGLVLANTARKQIALVLDKEDWHGEMNDMNYFLRDDYMANESTYPLKVVFDGYAANTDWYIKIAGINGYNITRKDKKELQPEDVILVQGKELVTYLDRHYVLEVKRNQVTAYLLRVISKK